MRITPHVTALALGIAGSLAFASSAHAAAFQLKENSAKGLGRAFAGSISAPGDASVIATNPAAMRGLDGRQFQADLSVISFSADFEGTGSYLGGLGGQIGGGNGGDAGKIAPVPAAYFHVPFGAEDNMHFGISLTAPFGFATEYDRDWVGRYNAVKTELEAVDLGFSFSYDVNPYVSFGGSVFVEHLSIELSNAIDFGTILYTGGAAALGFRPGNADGFSTIKGSNNEIGFTVGALLSPSEDTHFGIAYRSKVEHDISGGDAYFDVPGNAAAVLAQVRPGWFVPTKGSATVTLPETLTFSLTHRINERWTVMGDVSRTAWAPAFDSVTVDFESAQDDTVLEFGYDDSTFASIGADYKLSDAVTLRGGLAYDETPTSYQHRDVRVPDQTRKWLSLGLSWTPNEKTEYNFGYTHLFVNDSRVSTSSATANHIFGGYDVGGDIFAASINYKF
ncbi:outer membrane protein transport protein [Luteimonas sp. J29]|jgi:long-chain fatty acid transport protein|uniref:outer membrane protein transport protein n=1 Tax=Luteimonas sp. J29 TaxID=935863 RepID=UPI00047DE78F|nr:outer membrane protein transport protein [Luteimonas sp. J29]